LLVKLGMNLHQSTIGAYCCNQKNGEDRWYSNSYFQGVFDGHRGEEVAEYASRYFYDLLLTNINEQQQEDKVFHSATSPPFSPEKSHKTNTTTATTHTTPECSSVKVVKMATVKSIETAKHILRRTFISCHQQAKQCKKLAGTTAVVFWSCQVIDDDVSHPAVACTNDASFSSSSSSSSKSSLYPKYGFCANAGDSRAVLSISGTSHRLTFDHKVNCNDELERIKKVGGKVELGRICDADGDGVLMVSRGIGNYDLEPSFTCNPYVSKPIRLNDNKNQFIVMASDGLWDVYDDQEVVDFVLLMLSNGNDSKTCACRLTESAITRGSKDDTTVIVNVLNERLITGFHSSGSKVVGNEDLENNRNMWSSPEKHVMNIHSSWKCGSTNQVVGGIPPPRRHLSRPPKKARKGSIRMRSVGENDDNYDDDRHGNDGEDGFDLL
jgi:serine/threonine protein phosphatase PrpC